MIVTSNLIQTPKVVTIDQNRWSRSVKFTGHDLLEWVVTVDQNTHEGTRKRGNSPEDRRQGRSHNETQVLVVHQNNQTLINTEFQGTSMWTLDAQLVLILSQNPPQSSHRRHMLQSQRLHFLFTQLLFTSHSPKVKVRMPPRHRGYRLKATGLKRCC